MKTKFRISAALLAVLLILSVLISCGQNGSNTPVTGTGESTTDAGNGGITVSAEDIVVLYTNDVHCGIDENIGYAGLAAYKKLVESRTGNVTLVDCGDAVQGDALGTVSKGELIVDLMNRIGYDYAVPGNHEFGYGMEQLSALIGEAEATYLGCNITYTGENHNLLSSVKPYEIKEYGGKKVAYIGVLTPASLTSAPPSSFMEDGKFVYGFYGESEEAFYAQVQKNIDACKEEGADHVIVLAHLGDEEGSGAPSSTGLIKHTVGIDAVLDGHAHKTISSGVVRDKEGNAVLLSSTGTKLNAIGQMVITADGYISTGLITDFGEKDSETEAAVQKAKDDCADILKEVVATSDIALSVSDEKGIRMVRNRETAIGNLCADACRSVSGADIAVVNGGGIRADLPKGNITYSDIISVHPHGNTLCVTKATGQQILDMLEMASRNTKSVYEENGNATGELGGFMQVSGLRYTIDTSVPSSVKLDGKGFFLSVDGERRVKDVQVQKKDGTYADIDPQATYTLASNSYLIKEGGDGINMFVGNELVLNDVMIDNQVLITYIRDTLQGRLGEKYAATEGRITVR